MDRLLALHLTDFDARIRLPHRTDRLFWKITWRCRHGDLVLPGEVLLEGRAAGEEIGEPPFAFTFPLAGQLSILIGSGREVPGETVVGEVLYGGALEAKLAGAVRQAELELSQAKLKRRHAADRCLALQPEHEPLAREAASLRQHITRLRQENDRREQALRLVARTRDQDVAPAPELVVPLLMARLRELFADGSSRLLPAAGDDFGLLARLLRVLARLRPTGLASRPTTTPVSSRFAALLRRLYAFHRDSFPPAPPGLPIEVPPAFLWSELCKYHLVQLGVEVPPDFDLARHPDDSYTPPPFPAEETSR